jgi:glycine betaine/proline transport system substrate-binding protein
MLKRTKTSRLAVGLMLAGVMLTGALGACSKSKPAATEPATTETAAAGDSVAAADSVAADSAAETKAAAESVAAAVETTASATPSKGGAGIKLAVNPWTGSAVNANVAKVVLEKMGTPVELVDIDENATWPGLDTGSLDAVLEVWPSGHAKDVQTYITDKKSVTDIGVLGAEGRIGWYIPQFAVDADPSLATWEGFKDAAISKKFATAETGALGQFLMGDPSYVTYDEQIIKNLGLPLKFVVGGSEAALITAMKQSAADKTPVLMQFWQPHWFPAEVKLARVTLPEPTADCAASAKAADGKYACDYPVDKLFKAASVKLEAKNAMAFNFLKKFQLTIDQQNEIAVSIEQGKLSAPDAAKKWVDANAAVVDAWMK